MTNEEYAIELAENISPYDIGGDNAAHYAAKDAALDAMEWKEQQLIDKACEWLEPVFKDLAGYNCGRDLIEDFKQVMKGE